MVPSKFGTPSTVIEVSEGSSRGELGVDGLGEVEGFRSL